MEPITQEDLIYRLPPLPTEEDPITSSDTKAMISSAQRNSVERMIIQDGLLQSQNFVSGSSGWQIDAQGNAEFNEGTFRGAVTAASIDIPNTTTANSFHVDTSGNSWWGATTLGASVASVTSAGVATFTSGTIGGWTLSSTTFSSSGSEIVINSSTSLITVGTGSNGINIDGSNGTISDSAGVWSLSGDGTVYLPSTLYGTGADGEYTLDGTQAAVGGLFSKSSNTYTLLKNANFSALTITSIVTLETNGYILLVTGVLDNAGIISNSGTNGGNASGVTIGTAGVGGAGNYLPAGPTASAAGEGKTNGPNSPGVSSTGVSKNPSLGVNGAGGGNGGAGDANGGGASTAGTATAETVSVDVVLQNIALVAGSEVTTTTNAQAKGATSLFVLSPSAGSAGGGGGGIQTVGGVGTSGAGGGGGGTGGIIEIIAQTITNTGTIRANGGNAGNGSNAVYTSGIQACGGGGGGSGGSGGVIILIYNTITLGTITVSGGTGGTGGTGADDGTWSSTDGATGGNGTAGKIWRLKIN